MIEYGFIISFPANKVNHKRILPCDQFAALESEREKALHYVRHICYNTTQEVRKMKFFVVSDVHGHYTQLIKALDDAGFDRENAEHTFLSCGDLFDRGLENVQVYDFVRSLPRKILLKGNHEDLLNEILTTGLVTENAIKNGTNITVAQFLGECVLDAPGYVDTITHRARIQEILEFLDAMGNYYETPKYVFTHGWLPILLDGRMPVIHPCWRQVSSEEWAGARWLEWQQLYGAGAVLKAKTIVCGHRAARMGYQYDSAREPDLDEPFYGDGVIAIDAHTVRSGIVNVLVIESN